jgi:hypothetical protein
MSHAEGAGLTMVPSEDLDELSKLLEGLASFLDHLFQQRPAHLHPEASPHLHRCRGKVAPTSHQDRCADHKLTTE